MSSEAAQVEEQYPRAMRGLERLLGGGDVEIACDS